MGGLTLARRSARASDSSSRRGRSGGDCTHHVIAVCRTSRGLYVEDLDGNNLEVQTVPDGTVATR